MEEEENWKVVIIDNIEWKYEISNLGRLRVKDKNKIKAVVIRGGYISSTIFYNSDQIGRAHV